MKIRMDKRYTDKIFEIRVKEDMAEFKGRYTDGDLRRAFMDWMEDDRIYYGDIVYCNVEAYDSGWAYGNVTHFTVNMMIDSFDKIYKVVFYCDMELTVRTEISTIREFKEV